MKMKKTVSKSDDEDNGVDEDEECIIVVSH